MHLITENTERQVSIFQMYAGEKDIQVLSSGHLYFSKMGIEGNFRFC